MKRLREARYPLDPSEEIQLEGLLNSTIKPVEPRDNFVRSLERKLVIEPGSVELAPARSVFSYLLLVSTIVLAVSMVVVASIRLLLVVLALLGLVQEGRFDGREQEFARN
jgi:hypothetical protein